MRKKSILLFLSVIFALFTMVRGNAANSSGTLYNSPFADEIHIGVVYPVELMDENTYLRKGIELAVNSINADGGVLGKTLQLIFRDDQNNTHLAMQIANTFFEQGIAAVIGHWSTNICYFLTDIYEENKTVMLTPAATGMNLFENDYRYAYRMIANNRVFAEAIAGHISEAGLSRTAVFYSDDEYGTDFSSVLEEELSKLDIIVVDRVTSITPVNIKPIMERWRAFGYDNVIVAATMPGIVEPIRLIHEADGGIPIYGADNFDRASFAGVVGSSIESVYKASYPLEKLDFDFLKTFRDMYGHNPNIHAISGYDSVYLLKDAMEAVGSSDSAAIAEYLSELRDYRAVSGVLSYDNETQEFYGFNVEVRGSVPR